MKKITAVFLAFNLLLVLFCGCENSNSLSSDLSYEYDAPNNLSVGNNTLYNLIKPDIEGNAFFEYRVDINNKIYLINNKQEDNISKILSFFDKFFVNKTDNFDYKNESFYIMFEDINKNLTIQINQKDQIYLNYEHIYYSDGIYDKLIQYLTPIFNENEKYYSLIYNEGKFTFSYEIYDTSGNIIDSDTNNKCGHISVCKNDIVWLWTQSGTGTLTRSAYFYDTKTRKKSPVYCGITDCYENLVLNSESKSVIISDMFSGTVLQTIDKFKMEPYDAIETILDARFVEGGAKVSITYLAYDFSKQTEIFDIIILK